MSLYCWSCGRRVSHGDECGRCARQMRERWEQAEAEQDAITRREAEARPALTVDDRICECCLQPSSFSPCQRCTDSEFGPLNRGENW
jgi:hypothetical protein